MFKSLFPEDRDLLPLTWWKQHPVYLAMILAIAGALSMVIYAILGHNVMSHFVYSVERAFGEWHLWTPITYVLANPPSLWTVLGCWLLWRFGEAVERHFGRRIFVKLLLVLLFVSPVFVTILHFVGFRGLACVGMMQLEFGVFVAFATLYPRAKINLILLTIDAWVLAAIFVGINALAALASRDWASLILLLANVGSAYLFVRFEKGELKVPVSVSFSPDDKPKKPAKKEKKRKKDKAGETAKNEQPDVDAILDKISEKGMASLTDAERKILDQASERKKRDG